MNEAERLFRDQLGLTMEDPGIPPFETVTEALRRFVSVDFAVEEENDGDGFLFEYGVFGSMPRPGFLLSFVRQLDVVDDDGDHEFYLQLRAEYRFETDNDLAAAGKHKDWWFKQAASIPFDQWLERVRADSIWSVLVDKSPSGFTITQEEI